MSPAPFVSAHPDPEPESPAARVVFECGSHRILVQDVLDEAWLRGDLRPVWRRFQDGQAAEALAAARGLEADPAELQAMSEAFRYDRNLLTGEETERWLAERGLTEDDFVDHLVLEYWRAHPPGRVAAAREEYAAAPPATRERFHRGILLSDDFATLARDASWRWSASVTLPPQRESPAEDDDAAADLAREREAVLAREGWDAEELEGLAGRLGRDPVWLEGALRREAVFRRAGARLLDPAILERALGPRRLALTRVAVETLVVPTADAAREAAFCVREEGTTLAGLAAECRFPFDCRDRLLGDCHEEEQRVLLAAAPGELLPPVARGDAYALARLVRREEPDLNQPEIRARVAGQVLEAEFSELADRHVRWPSRSTPGAVA